MRSEERASSISIILRYSDWIDVVLMLMGALGAIGDGMSTKVLLLFASRIMNSLGYGNNQQNSGSSMGEVEKCSLYFVYLRLAAMVVAFMGNPTNLTSFILLYFLRTKV